MDKKDTVGIRWSLRAHLWLVNEFEMRSAREK